MSNDAKIGLVGGLGLVILAALIYCRKDANALGFNLPAGTPEASLTAAGPGATADKNTARLTGQRKHVVQEGDTLTNLAQRYYGDRESYKRIYEANRDKLLAPDRLPPGTVLMIPETSGK